MLPALASAFALLAAAADGAAPLLPDAWEMVCEPGVATGLEWKGAAWSPTTPPKAAFTVAKLPDNQCPQTFEAGLQDFGDMKVREVCLSRRFAGEAYDPWRGSVNCAEYYKRTPGGWDLRINCFGVNLTAAMRPGGWHHRAQITTVVGDDPRKAVQILEAGHCGPARPVEVKDE